MSNSSSTAMVNSDGTKVIIFTWLMTVITIGLLIARLILSAKWKRRFGLDEAFLLGAGLLGIIQTVLTAQAGQHGLGIYIRSSNIAQVKLFAQFMYSSDLMFIIVLAASKISSVCLLQRIVLDRFFTKRVAPLMHATIALWTIFSLLSLAFQCSFPMPWLYVPSSCVASGALWYPILLTSVLINIFISGAALSERRKIPLGGRQAKVTIVLFASRFSVCLMTIIQLAILSPALHSDYQSKDMVIPTIMRQLVMNLSIWTAAVPVLYKSLAMLSPTCFQEFDEKHSAQRSPSGSSRGIHNSTFNHWRSGSSSSWSAKTMESKGRTDATRFQSLPRLTLSFSAFNGEADRRSRSRFSGCFTYEKNMRNSLSPEERIIRQTLESSVGSESNRQLTTNIKILQQPLRTYHP